MHESTKPTSLLRVRQVLERVQVSRSKWYAGVQSGAYPRPVRLGERAVAWLSRDIDELIEKLGADR